MLLKKKKTVIKYKEKHKVWNLHIYSYLAGSILAGSHANLIFIFSKKPKGGSQASQNRGGARWKSDPASAGNRVGRPFLRKNTNFLFFVIKDFTKDFTNDFVGRLF